MEQERRTAPLALGADEFREIGHALVDDLAAMFEALESPSELAIANDETPADVQAALGGDGLPEHGAPARELVREARDLLLAHTTHIGHPRFWGYVCGSQAPIGALAELLAAAVNPNVGAWQLGPVATEIERQTVRWLAELIGFPGQSGLLVSGGNMANFVGFLAARRAKAPWDVAMKGTREGRLTAYCSAETHTWVDNASDLFGIGGDAMRWIATDADRRMDTRLLRETIAADRAAGATPFIVIGTGGSVGTGAIDPLPELAEICRTEDLWFHVDGAYGGFAACLPDAPADLKSGIALADSVAIDPHKWLYVPVEAGCALVRDQQVLLDAFSYRPPYYHLPDGQTNFYELGPQNSRGFRALKVWLALRHAGRDGYVELIGEDCRLARLLYDLADSDSELEARTQGLSITTFRYAPPGAAEDELDELNERLLDRIKASGEAFVSNAVIDGRYYLRACFVNFRTQEADVRALPGIVKRLGAEVRAGQTVA